MDDAPFDLPRLDGLTRPEHLSVWALRTIVLGHGDCPALERAFAQACGEGGSQALVTYHAVIKLIAMTGRRSLRIHIPGCACVSSDEAAILGVVEAAQGSLAGDETTLNARIAAMLGGEPPRTLVMAAQAVGQILQTGGLRLPARRREAEVIALRPTVH